MKKTIAAKPSPAVAAASSPPATPLDDPGATGDTGSSSMGSSMGSSTVSYTGSSSTGNNSIATAAKPPPAGTAVKDAEEARRLCFEAEKAARDALKGAATALIADLASMDYTGGAACKEPLPGTDATVGEFPYCLVMERANARSTRRCGRSSWRRFGSWERLLR